MILVGKTAKLHELALRVYLEAAYLDDYIAMIVCMAVVHYIETHIDNDN